MDPDRFLRELPTRFDDFPLSAEPRDTRFAGLLAEIEGLATPNTLALVHHALSLLEPGECFVEVGSFRGASLIAALLDNEDKEVIALDRFTMRGATPELLHENLARFGLRGVPTVLVGDAFELVRDGARRPPGRCLVLRRRARLRVSARWARGGRAVPRARALLIVDDTDWVDVARAVADYLAAQPRVRRILSLEGEEHGNPQWWAGMQVLAWGG